MLKTIRAQDARKRLGELMDRVKLRGDYFIIERDGRPMVGVVPLEFLDKVLGEKVNKDGK